MKRITKFVALGVFSLSLVLAFVIGSAQANPALPSSPDTAVEPAIGARQLTGTAQVWVVHAAPFSDTITGTTVSVAVDGTDAITDFQYGEDTGAYVPITLDGDPTVIQLKVDGVAVYTKPFTLTNAVSYTVIAVGGAYTYDLDLLPIVDDNEPPSGSGNVRVIHAAPFTTTDDATVDVLLADNTPVITELGYTEDELLTLPAATYNLKVVSTGTISPTLIDIPGFTVEDGDAWNVLAIGEGINYTPEVLPLQTQQAPETVPATLVVTPTSLSFMGMVSATDIASQTFQISSSDSSTFTWTASEDSSWIDLSATSGTATSTVAVSIDTTGLMSGTYMSSITVTGMGLLSSPTTVDVTLTLTEMVSVEVTETAKVWVAHLAPFASPMTATAVNIRVDGTVVLTDVMYPQDTGGYVDIPLDGDGNTFVEVLVGNTVAISGTLPLMADTEYTLAATGDDGNQDLAFLPLFDDNTQSDGQAKVNIIHAAPFVSGTASVDIYAMGVPTPLVSGLDYFSSTGYVALPPATYTLMVYLAGMTDTPIITVADFPLLDGDVYNIFAIGGTNGYPATVSALRTAIGMETMPEMSATLDVEPMSLSFMGMVSGTNPADQTFTISSSDDGMYDWTASEDSNWISLAPISGTTPSTVTVSIDTTGLMSGTYMSSITVTGMGLLSSPTTVDVTLTLTEMVVVEDDPGRVKIAHLAPFLPDGAPVDVSISDGTMLTLSYSDITSDYLEFAAGTYVVTVTPQAPGGSPIVFSHTAETGTDITIAATGDSVIAGIGSQPVGILTLTDDNTPLSDAGKLRLVHAAPFATGDAAVDILLLDDTPLVTDFVYGEAVTLTLPPGEYDLKVAVSGSVNPAIGPARLVVEAGDVATIYAIGNASEEYPLDLLPDGDIEVQPVPQPALLVEPTMLTFTAIEGGDNPADQTFTISNAGLGMLDWMAMEASDWLSVTPMTGTAPSTVTVSVDTTGVMSGTYNTVITVTGMGALSSPATVNVMLTLEAATPITPAQVKVAHFAPFAPGGAVVDVLVNGGLLLDDFAYGQVMTSYVDLAPGTYTVTVVPQVITAEVGAAQTGIDTSVTVASGVDYTLAATGDGTNQDVTILPLVDDNTPTTDTGEVRVVHVAPFTSGMAAVDVLLLDNTPLITDLVYLEAQTLSLPAGVYDVKVAAAGTTEAVIGPLELTVEAGDIATVFAIGGISEEYPLTAQPDGNIDVALTMLEYYLPIILNNQ